jgi:uncharacterized protein
MSLSLSDPADLLLLAGRRTRVREELSLGQLARLVEALPATDPDAASVCCDLRVAFDEGGTVHVRGEVASRWTLICQRCLEPFEEAVRIPLHWRSGELPDGDFTLDDGPVRLADWVEDELLLRLPDVPRHADLGQCAAWVREHLIEPAPAPETRTPFAGLKNLLSERDD